METNTVIVVMSCDAYEDTWPIFFQLKEKYWSLCPYPTRLVTEGLDYPGVECLYTAGAWTKRLREALEQIDSEFVILMLDDFFIRQEVDRYRIAQCINVFMKDRPEIAVFSFEPPYADTLPCEFGGFRQKPFTSQFRNTCQPGVWRRDWLLSRLQMDTDAWTWEEMWPVYLRQSDYINSGEQIIDIGHYAPGDKWGVVQGKWVVEDMIPLMIKEQFALPMERGFCTFSEGKLKL